MPWLAAMVGAPLVSGAIGSMASADDRAAAVEANSKAIQQWLDVNVPDIEQQKIIMQRYIQTGELDPKSEEMMKLGPSAMEKVKEQLDPRLKNAQLDALSQLEDLGHSGGMTLADKANLQKSLIDINAADKGRRESIVDNFQRRGMGGSGAALIAQLQGAQDASTRQSNQELETLGSARQRALEAILKGGQLAGDIRGQEYGMAKDVAGSQDAIAKFNIQNAQGVQQRNVDRDNAAQEYNLNLKQRVSDANTDIANKEKVRNADLLQQQFQNRATVAAGRSGQYNQQANQLNNSADRTAQQWANIGSGVSQGIGAYGSYANNKDLLDKYFGQSNEFDPDKMDYDKDGNLIYG